jgi:hypothetical protein
MALKKTNQKDLKEAQEATGEWSISKCSRHNLANLVLGGLLQERDVINWRLSLCDPFPMENVDEIISFCSFFERGLALPTCSFFRGLLYYYGIELQHLNPNSICHISIFIHLCEAFLGIEPHWALVRYLFRMKPQPTSKNPSVIGGLASSLGNMPVRNTYLTNSRPMSPGGNSNGSTLRTTPPNSLRVQADLLFSAPNGPWSLLRQRWTR